MGRMKRYRVEYEIATDKPISRYKGGEDFSIIYHAGKEVNCVIPNDSTATITELEIPFVPGYFVNFSLPNSVVREVRWCEKSPHAFSFDDWRRVEVKEVKD
jgi:hypothetical protein